jgi:hypothetical protein
MILPTSQFKKRFFTVRLVITNTTLFFPIGQYPQILSHFEKNSEQVKSEVRHEQAYLSREIHKLGKLHNLILSNV